MAEIFPGLHGILGQGSIEKCLEVGGGCIGGHGIMGEMLDVLSGTEGGMLELMYSADKQTPVPGLRSRVWRWYRAEQAEPLNVER